MPRRYLHPDEARDLRIMGLGDEIEIDENGEYFIDYTSSESSSSEDETDFLERYALEREEAGFGAARMLAMRRTPEERAQSILQGDFYGIDFQNLTPKELEAFETFVSNYIQRFSLYRPDPRRRYGHFSVPNCIQQAQLEPEPENVNVNLAQLQPEEIDLQLLQLAFSDIPEVDVLQLLNLVTPGGPGDPGGSGSEI